MASSRAPVTLVVVDCRQVVVSAGNSGIGRFTGALAAALYALAQSSNGRLELCFVAPHPSLAAALRSRGVLSHGSSHGSCLGPVAVECVGRLLYRVFPKPRSLWATYVFGVLALRLRRATSRKSITRCIWVAPDNIDRPLMLAPWRQRTQRWSVVQVVHDLIPLQFPTQHNRALRFQLRALLGLWTPSWLSVAPVSGLTALDLQSWFGRESEKLRITGPLGLCLDQAYVSALAQMNSLEGPELVSEMRRVLPELATWLDKRRTHFVLGVGRDETYKRWPLAALVVRAWHQQLQTQAPGLGQELLFIHVCAESSSGDYAKEVFGHGQPLSERVVFYPESRVIRFLQVDDYTLACLYRLAEVFLHCSQREGFGLPAAEAYLAGCSLRVSPECGFREVLSLLVDKEDVILSEPEASSVPGSDLGASVQSGYGYSVTDRWIFQNMPILCDSWDSGARLRLVRSRRRLDNPLARDLLGSTTSISSRLRLLLEER